MALYYLHFIFMMSKYNRSISSIIVNLLGSEIEFGSINQMH